MPKLYSFEAGGHNRIPALFLSFCIIMAFDPDNFQCYQEGGKSKVL